MQRKRYTEEQIVRILGEAEGGATAWVIWDSSQGGELISGQTAEASDKVQRPGLPDSPPGPAERSTGRELNRPSGQVIVTFASEPSWPWWEDEAILDDAREAYAAQLAIVRDRVADFGVRSGGEVYIRKALDTGAALFLSREFPLQIHEIKADGYLAQADAATSLTRLYANFRDYGIDVDEVDAVNRASLVNRAERDPWSFAPALLAQLSLPGGEYSSDPDFIQDAKALYLEYFPSVGDVERQISVGETAAIESLVAAGLERADLNNAFEHVRIISPEAIAGHASLDSLRADFQDKFSRLVAEHDAQ